MKYNTGNIPDSVKRGYLESDFRIFHLTDRVLSEVDSHYHEFHKIIIFLSGSVQYDIEGKTYCLEPYDIVLVQRNDIHRILIDPSVPYERVIIYISPAFMDSYRTDSCDLSECFRQAKLKNSSVLRIHALEKSSLFRVITRLEHSLEDTEYAADLYRRILFLEFMIQLNRAAFKNRIEFLDTELYNPKIVDLIHYISTHLAEPLTVDTLAARSYLSRYYMMRLFKSETGYTIGSYITYRRLLLTRDLILQGMPVTEACLASGFKDYSTFSRAYRKEFSEQPRKLLRTANASREKEVPS